MLKLDELLRSIEKAASLAELQSNHTLPDPFDDGGYYLVYYAKQDYRQALYDIVRFAGDGMRIYYDRYLETGEAHQRDFVAKAHSIHCRCVVFYLSENVFSDSVFAELCHAVATNHIPYISVNLETGGQYQSGAQMARTSNASDQLLADVDRIFPDQVTYLPCGVSYADKKRELSTAYLQSAMHFSAQGDFAVATYVKDLAEEEIIIPPSVEIQGKAYPVKAVGAYAFSGCRQLKRISFPDTVEDIGYGYSNASLVGVFNNCESLEEIVYPPHVKTLYGGMFNGCTALKRLILNDSLTFEGSPGDTHFSTTPASGVDLSEVDLDTTDRLWGEIPTVCCLQELHLPDCAKIVTSDEENNEMRFVYCSDDAWISVWVSVEHFSGGGTIEIQKDHLVTSTAECYCFSGNDTPERIVFPKTLNFSEKWFRFCVECGNVREVILPETVKCLEDCFRECPKLETVVLPESLQALCGNCFHKCPAIREIRFPSFLYEIDTNCFVSCGVQTIVSDSIHSKRLFCKGSHIPFMIAAEKNTLLRLYLKAIFYVTSIPFILENKKTFPFYLWTNTSTIYITDRVKPFKIEGFSQVDSDRAGYRRYDCQLTSAQKLKMKFQEVERVQRHNK